MAAPSATPTPAQHPSPKRPRLSLQTKTVSNVPILGKSVTSLRINVDPSSPTSFNTLSNAYAAAIERASPNTARPRTELDPKTAINTARPTSLRLQTPQDAKSISLKTQTPGPFSIVYPDTPSSAIPSSSTTEHPPEGPTSAVQSIDFTPPQSAQPHEQRVGVFTFASSPRTETPISPRTPRRRATIGSLSAPYTHPRALHSILRNSPLPPRTARSPITARKLSHQIAQSSSKRVEYDTPLTQTITTNMYIKSHIELLAEEASPYSPRDPEALDLAMADASTRDGGQTPGPFEEMRRRMAGFGTEIEGDALGVKKRKKREKPRQWRWTIGVNGEDLEEESLSATHTPLTAVLPSQSLPDWTKTSSDEGSDQSGVDSGSDIERPGSSQSV